MTAPSGLGLLAVLLFAQAAPEAPRPDGEPARAPEATRLTFNRDIAPIAYEKCAPCHHPGGGGPFNLLGYQDFAKRAEQVDTVIESRYMPPWLPEPGPDFAGVRRLSDEQLATLRSWIAEGAPEGAPADLPPPPVFPPGWQLGRPDLVVEMPEPYQLPAEGKDVFRSFVLPVAIPATRFVRAVEIRPFDKRLVHHALVYVDRTGSVRALDGKDPGPGFEGMGRGSAEVPDGQIIGWLPGRQPFAGYPDIAWRLDPGSDLLLQLHMLPTGKPEKVRARLGLYFARKPPTRFQYVVQIGPQFIDIPPGARDHVLTDSYLLPVDVDLLALQPHAHYLGREVEGWATLPDGSRQTLIHIRQWDFNWQDAYRYAQPVFLPRGTTLSLRLSYDNSADNVRNPSHPPQRVRLGWSSFNEMCELWFQVVPRSAADMQVLTRDCARVRVQKDVVNFELAVRAEPENAGLQRELANAYFRSNRFADAEKRYLEVLRLEPADLQTNWVLAKIYKERGDTEALLGRLRRIVELDPEEPGGVEALATILLDRGRSDEARARFAQLVRLRPDNGRAQLQLADLLEVADDLAGAAAHLEQAVRIDPNAADPHKKLAAVYVRQGKDDAAAAEFESVLRLDPDSVEAHFFLGRVARRRGALREAAAHYAEVLRLKPFFPPAQRALDEIKAEIGH